MSERLTDRILADLRAYANHWDSIRSADARLLLSHIDAQKADIDRLRELLGEAKYAIDLLLMYQPTCEQAVHERAAIRSGVRAEIAEALRP